MFFIPILNNAHLYKAPHPDYADVGVDRCMGEAGLRHTGRELGPPTSRVQRNCQGHLLRYMHSFPWRDR